MAQLTFGQSIGAEPMPSQAALRTISQETRSHLWAAIYKWFTKRISDSGGYGPSYFERDASDVFFRWWVIHKHKMADERPRDPSRCIELLKAEASGSYVDVYNLAQFLLDDPD